MKSSGQLSADEHDSVCVLGLIGKSYEATPAYHLKDITDFTKRVSTVEWWLELKILNEILAHYQSKQFIGERDRSSTSFIHISPVKPAST